IGGPPHPHLRRWAMRPGRPRRSSPPTVAPHLPGKQARLAWPAPPGPHTGRLIESARGVGPHCVNFSRIGTQIVSCHRGTAIAARFIVEQPLEFVNIVLDRLTKIRIGPVFTAYLLKCALPLGSIKTLGEDTALAALIAIPQICGGIIVDHPGDIDRE